MSGFSSSVAAVPYELKDEMRPPVGFDDRRRPCRPRQRGGPAARRESIRAPSVSEIATTGILIGTGRTRRGLRDDGGAEPAKFGGQLL